MRIFSSIRASLFVGVLLLGTITLLLLGSVVTWQVQERGQQEVASLRKQHEREQRAVVKAEVRRAVNYVQYARAQAEEELKEQIKEQVEQGVSLINSLLVQYAALPDNELRRRVADIMRPVRFRGTGYFYIFDTDGVGIMHPVLKAGEGKSILGLQDANEVPLVPHLIQIATTRGEGYYDYPWKKANSSHVYRKIAYVQLIEEKGWVVGCGEYISDRDDELKQQVVNRLGTVRFAHGGYLSGGSFGGDALLGPGQGQVNIDLEDANGVKVVQELIAAARAGGGFVEYWLQPVVGVPFTHRVSYAEAIPEWGWYIAAGSFVDDMDDTLGIVEQEIRGSVVYIWYGTGALIVLFWLAGWMFCNIVNRNIRHNISMLEDFLNESIPARDVPLSSMLTLRAFEGLANSASTMLGVQHKSRQELAASEERFKQLVEQSPLALMVFDLNGDLEQTNRACGKLWNVDDPDVLIGEYNILTDPQAVTTGGAEAFRAAKQGRITDIGEAEYTPSFKGAIPVTKFVHVRMYPLHSQEGEVRNVVAMLEDITVHKWAQEALKDSEQKLQAMIEAAYEGVIVILDGRLVFANSRMEELLGYEKSELVNEQYVKFVAAEDRKLVMDRYQARLAGKEVIGLYDFRAVRKSGELIWLQVSSSLFNWGSETAILAFVTDITERKLVDDELRRSENRFRTIFNSVQDAVLIHAMDGAVLDCNAPALELLDIAKDDMFQLKFVDYAPDVAGKQDLSREWSRVVSSEVSWGEWGVRPWQQDYFVDVEMYMRRIPFFKGRDVILVTMRNVTERKRIQEIMVQTEKMMSVGGLAAGMAHEINNPLGGILQAVQNVVRRVDERLPANHKAADSVGCSMEQIRSYLEMRGIFRMLNGIKDSGERAADIVANMLNFSRRSESMRQPTNLNELVEETIALAANDYDLKKNYDFRKIHMEKEYGDGVESVPCTKTEISQVLLNLLRNAAQAMGEYSDDAGTISIQTRARGAWAEIFVQDTGPGMPEEVRKRAFEPFFTTKAPGMGTGLGLSVSYFIVTENHNGEFEVESEHGKGTRFIIRLPL